MENDLVSWVLHSFITGTGLRKIGCRVVSCMLLCLEAAKGRPIARHLMYRHITIYIYVFIFSYIYTPGLGPKF